MNKKLNKKSNIQHISEPSDLHKKLTTLFNIDGGMGQIIIKKKGFYSMAVPTLYCLFAYAKSIYTSTHGTRSEGASHKHGKYWITLDNHYRCLAKSLI